MDTYPKYEISLFSGAGGGLLASKWLLGWRTVCYVERESYPVEVIKVRIRDGWLDDAPIWDDVRTFRRDNPECGEFVERLAQLDNLVITGGFPCQPFSSAGRQRGPADERNMWPDTARIIHEIRPACVFLENVPAIISSGYFGRILGDLASIGYDCRWDCLPASAVGANHQRDRLWIVGRNVADTNDYKCQIHERCIQKEIQKRDDVNGGSQSMADADQPGLALGQSQPGNPQPQFSTTLGARRETGEWWQVEPDMGRMVDGLASRVDRLKALGNGQIPLVAAVAWLRLSA